jgi:hypothetical protein
MAAGWTEYGLVFASRAGTEPDHHNVRRTTSQRPSGEPGALRVRSVWLWQGSGEIP